MTATRTPTSPTAPAIDLLVASIESADPIEASALHPDVVLDATLPNWRLTRRRGPQAVIVMYADFYKDPGHLDDLRRQPIAGGELVELTLSWEEQGVPHVVHQVHLVVLDDEGRIVRDTMFCGGRWTADLLAEMETADALV